MSGAYSSVSQCSTIDRPPGGSAALRFYFTADCPMFFGEREFTVYGQLAVSGNAWQFSVAPNRNPDSTAVYDLVMDLIEANAQMTGTIRGSGIDPIGFPVLLYNDTLSSAATAFGRTELNRRLWDAQGNAARSASEFRHRNCLRGN